MTRANINYVYQNIGEHPRTLYYYQNGDQYPRGMRDYYKVLDFTNGDWSIDSFKDWLGMNYKETKSVAYKNKKTGMTVVENYVPTEISAKPTEIDHACIYFDDCNFPTDYSYIFDASLGKTIIVYEWRDKVFEGNPEEFSKWIKKQK